MISDVVAIVDKQDPAVRSHEKVGRHLRHLYVGASPESVTHRADPVGIEARKHIDLRNPAQEVSTPNCR
jgi:hypothetical protein